MSAKISFTDLGEAYRVLEQLPQKLEDSMLTALNEAADFMIIIAKGYCPVDTGTLQGSIRKEQYSNAVIVIAGGREFINPKTNRFCNYAVYVETHTPFMHPAYQSIRHRVREIIKERVIAAVEQAR